MTLKIFVKTVTLVHCRAAFRYNTMAQNLVKDWTNNFHITNEKGEEEKGILLKNSHISILSDDCLINIFMHLSIKDRIVVERGIFLTYYNDFCQMLKAEFHI